MPNRVLRDWTDSERVASLDVHAERFFVRLIMKADDFGRLTGNTKLLRPLLYPLLLNEIRDSDLQRLIAACVKAGLVRLYEVAGKQYLEIKDFRQRTRADESKFPAPPDDPLSNGGHVTVTRQTDDRHSPAHTDTETDTSTKTQRRGARRGVSGGPMTEERIRAAIQTGNGAKR
jgi:hypothetical protein